MFNAPQIAPHAVLGLKGAGWNLNRNGCLELLDHDCVAVLQREANGYDASVTCTLADADSCSPWRITAVQIRYPCNTSTAKRVVKEIWFHDSKS